jgi:hypothetical protein
LSKCGGCAEQANEKQKSRPPREAKAAEALKIFHSHKSPVQLLYSIETTIYSARYFFDEPRLNKVVPAENLLTCFCLQHLIEKGVI